jgi:hypothetical protein
MTQLNTSVVRHKNWIDPEFDLVRRGRQRVHRMSLAVSSACCCACTKIAARVLGVEERMVDNAVLFALTGGRGFVSQVETLPAHCQPGYVR